MSVWRQDGKDAQGAQWMGARVRAVAEKGRANAALIALLAKGLDWPRSAISLESGDANRLKRLRIKDGVDALARLSVIIRERVEAA